MADLVEGVVEVVVVDVEVVAGVVPEEDSNFM